MTKRLFIIQPSYYRARSNLAVHKSRKRTLVPLTLPYLAALTPPEWEVQLIDEQLKEVDFQAPVDLVAITTWTINSFRAYEIADRFRERKVPVIMGGPHTYFYSQEAGEHCDAPRATILEKGSHVRSGTGNFLPGPCCVFIHFGINELGDAPTWMNS